MPIAMDLFFVHFPACRSKCSRVDYEFRPCTGTHDRQCKGWVCSYCQIANFALFLFYTTLFAKTS